MSALASADRTAVLDDGFAGGNRASATLCPRGMASRTVTVDPSHVEAPTRLERLERRRHVVAIADHQNGLHWLTPLARKPPSTARMWPVTNVEASEARNTAAPTSSSSFAEPVHRRPRQQLLPARRIEQRAVEIGAEDAGCDGVHRDVVRRPFNASARVNPATADLLVM